MTNPASVSAILVSCYLSPPHKKSPTATAKNNRIIAHFYFANIFVKHRSYVKNYYHLKSNIFKFYPKISR